MSTQSANAGFAAKLREEIEQGQARRHEYCMKKLAFSTGLLGAGALSVPFKTGFVDLSALLWLVPVVAIGFDLYIVSEDFGVKRAGAFLALPESGASEAERKWESTFVTTHSSPFAAIAFFLVSLVLIMGAFVVLLEIGTAGSLLATWAVLISLAEVGLLAYSLRVRKLFDTSESDATQDETRASAPAERR